MQSVQYRWRRTNGSIAPSSAPPSTQPTCSIFGRRLTHFTTAALHCSQSHTSVYFVNNRQSSGTFTQRTGLSHWTLQLKRCALEQKSILCRLSTTIHSFLSHYSHYAHHQSAHPSVCIMLMLHASFKLHLNLYIMTSFTFNFSTLMCLFTATLILWFKTSSVHLTVRRTAFAVKKHHILLQRCILYPISALRSCLPHYWHYADRLSLPSSVCYAPHCARALHLK